MKHGKPSTLEVTSNYFYKWADQCTSKHSKLFICIVLFYQQYFLFTASNGVYSTSLKACLSVN